MRLLRVLLDRMRSISDGTAFLSAALLAGFALIALPPVWFLIEGSFRLTNSDGSPGPLTLANYAGLLRGPGVVRSVFNSAIFATGSAVLAILIGGVQAWIVERTDAPLKSLAYLGAIISLAIPYILFVVSWLLLLGRVGPVNNLLELVLGTAGPPIDVQSLWGMILIEGLLWGPLVFLMLASSFRAANAGFEEAALACGARSWAIVYQITLKLALPAIAAVGLLVIIRGIESFEVPALVGLPGHVDVMTTEIFLRLETKVPPDLGGASAFAVLLLCFAAALLYLYGRLSRNAAKYQTITGKGYRPRRLELGPARYLAGAVVATNFLLTVALPVAALFWASLLPFYQTVSRRALSLLTLKNYHTVFQSTAHLDAVWNTLFLSFGTATIIMALTSVAGWLIARRRRGAWILDQLGMMPLVFPGIVLAVAIMQVFLAVPLPIYGTIWILLVAFATRYQPYGLRYSVAGVQQIHRELEEVASAAGASRLKTFLRVVLPLIAPSLTAGWLFIFLLTARDLSMPVLLAGPGSQVVAVDLYDLWTNGQGTELAAFGLVWIALMTIVAAAFHLSARRIETARFGG